jgi:hypothetical protein
MGNETSIYKSSGWESGAAKVYFELQKFVEMP